MKREQLNNLRHGPSTTNVVVIVCDDGSHYPTNGANIIREARLAGSPIIGQCGPTYNGARVNRYGDERT